MKNSISENENTVTEERIQEEVEIDALQFTPHSANTSLLQISPDDIRLVPIIRVLASESKRTGKSVS